MTSTLTVLGLGEVTAEPGDAGAPALPKLDLSLLERTLRRGLSDVTRLFMHAAGLALADARVGPADVQVIFASALGEIATAEALLAEAHDADASSPARFRNSVHNTATGLLSISSRSRLPCTAIAAGWDTVAMGLVEASAQLAAALPGDPGRVLLVLAEERVPRAIAREHDHAPLAVALVLARGAHFGRGRLRNLRRAPRPEGPPLDHPLAPALALSYALTHHRSGTIALGQGEEPWCVDVDASEVR